jgi:hypothetical protein
MGYETSFENAIDTLAGRVDWEDDFGDIKIDDTELNNALIGFVASQFKVEFNYVFNKLVEECEYQLTLPDPDAELKEHLEYERQQELNQPVP